MEYIVQNEKSWKGNMTIREISAKSILRTHKKADSWFVSNYHLNLYRGCEHNCTYCDGRAEKYNASPSFGEEVEVKTNAVEVLARELDPAHKRKQFKRGYVMVGGGVGDSYQPAEAKYGLMAKTLGLLGSLRKPVFVLTKSVLVERDLDLLRTMNRDTGVILGMSFSSVNEKLSALLEPGVPGPRERLRVLKRFHDAGIPCGMYLMPIVPCITDTPAELDRSVKAAKDAGADFVVFGAMTLKPGRQRDYFFDTLSARFPKLRLDYGVLYDDNKWSTPAEDYSDTLHELFLSIASKYRMPVRVPPRFYADFFDINDRVTIILEHIDYYMRMKGGRSPFGYAAYQISKLTVPIVELGFRIGTIEGVGRKTAQIIREIIETGTSSLYENLLYYRAGITFQL
jgi:DNA repair photolyase